jgi:hypothetical protein
MRPLHELREAPDPAWPGIEAAIANAVHPVQVLPVDSAMGGTTLERLQVTTGSALGALALFTGWLVVDHGWLRVLGGGPPPMNLALANDLETPAEQPPGRLLVAFDVLGGQFAINGGDLPGGPGELCYYAPDELAWCPMGMGHGAFIAWAMTERLDQFNKHLRWPAWEAEVEVLDVDQGLSLYPFPFTEEGRDLARVSRAVVAITELLTGYPALEQQLRGVSNGESVTVNVDHDEVRP